MIVNIVWPFSKDFIEGIDSILIDSLSTLKWLSVVLNLVDVPDV